ncbi:hypothetical protein HOLleu_44229 [Holothuria leucospilota]|uniref:Uncharacterized protein n=1 Tax=Holothuria leucospilota TaxID=206669 RepID=A0A9Q0YG32_HOLLE|nr:hypothetical protein HOLleu_44229 [Holothuria leucospilota]
MWGHQGSKTENLVCTISQDALWREDECCSFWWRSKVIWGHQQSNTENFLLKQYLKMTYGEKMNPVIFGGGQRSFGVTESQILKTLLTQYLKEKILDRFHTWYIG